jgi:hypothetical protein
VAPIGYAIVWLYLVKPLNMIFGLVS